MKILDTVGIDISKLTFDVRIHKSQDYKKFNNEPSEIKKFIKWVYKTSNFNKENIFFILEHTGLYSYQMSAQLTEDGVPFALVPGLQVKLSLGIKRGKDDKVDATDLALFAYRLRDEIKPYKLPSKELLTLKHLLSLRERIVKQRAGYKASLREQKRVLLRIENSVLLTSQERIIKSMTKQILAIEKEINDIIKSDELLSEQYKLIISIKGVGAQTAFHMIVYTDAFTKFATWRKFASYSGIAPFPHTSGTSVRGKTKVSNLANKKMKTLFDLCAKSAIQHNPEMVIYYNRRLKEGKTKMGTINIIRNKLLSRIFAVVERRAPYVNTMKYAA